MFYQNMYIRFSAGKDLKVVKQRKLVYWYHSG